MPRHSPIYVKRLEPQIQRCSRWITDGYHYLSRPVTNTDVKLPEVTFLKYYSKNLHLSFLLPVYPVCRQSQFKQRAACRWEHSQLFVFLLKKTNTCQLDIKAATSGRGKYGKTRIHTALFNDESEKWIAWGCPSLWQVNVCAGTDDPSVNSLLFTD